MLQCPVMIIPIASIKINKIWVDKMHKKFKSPIWSRIGCLLFVVNPVGGN